MGFTISPEKEAVPSCSKCQHPCFTEEDEPLPRVEDTTTFLAFDNFIAIRENVSDEWSFICMTCTVKVAKKELR